MSNHPNSFVCWTVFAYFFVLTSVKMLARAALSKEADDGR